MAHPRTPRRTLLAGGSGFLGGSLAAAMLRRGDRPEVLSRRPRPAGLDGRIGWHRWDGSTLGDWAGALDGADGIVNLAGRTVDCRKTRANQAEILRSRIDSCRVLGEACRAAAAPPPVWVQAATAHIVGDPRPKDRICDETTPPGPPEEMAPRVGTAWEKAFDAARLPTQRGVTLRISFVLGPGGGALGKLVRFTRMGLGGTVGPGDQWISWIHHADLDRLFLRALEDPSLSGVYVATAPKPVTNREFMAALRAAHRRPWSPPAPALCVRLFSRFVLDTDPELALEGRRCVPTRLVAEAGFAFEHPEVRAALADLA
ncbi:epimerase [Phycisphaera mikurensis]|uniref:TIGR01777 family protein n=1 Tax=Phycisphaera mikurensis (strain NBRC 102666 / KCTC 22515 / FYK2301M01) TaxID=1142394 RepID=I0IAV4_PHYMF|nr:DUF1731 domain-containing protein [Phycisphaera mikurensis]MBB6442634.1 hypothetical protein [Phycisphaera mikurensis]BAM02392.1 hypothetical protein PSMK_02330 [Phycisphaera mikurensis NBRC 102666]